MARDRELGVPVFEAGAAVLAPGLGRGHPKKLEPLLLSAMLAVSLHAAMLSLRVRNETGETRPPMRAATQSTTVRLLAVSPVPRAAKGVDGRERFDAAGEARESKLPVPSLDVTIERQSQPLPAPSAVAAPPAHGLALPLPGVLGDEDFFARHALDVGPYPTRAVMIDYPANHAGGGTHVSELTLFIDETGRVVRLRVEGPRLPTAMEEAARSAFMGAAFSPGQVDGLPVRSRIRVEVVFEEGAADR